MSIESLFKKRLLFFFTSFAFIVVTTISSSYAILNKNNVENYKVINNENLRIIYENGNFNTIDSGYPMSYEQGTYASPSNIIEVINNGDEDTQYHLNIKFSSEPNSLDSNKILYSINGSEPKILGDSNTYKSVVKKNSKEVLDIRIWAYDKLVTNDDQGKKIDISFEVLKD